jgi:hypothetical protein
MLMGMTWSLTTGATTAKPPTEEVTDTAGVRMPSAIVSAVANRVYRGTIRENISIDSTRKVLIE